jgi:putative hydrolase of the HAD superfamily
MTGQPIEAVLFDYGYTLIYFDEDPHAHLVEAYQAVNRLLSRTLAREVPDARTLIERVSRAVDAEIQADYDSGRPEEVEIATVYDGCLRRLGLELSPAVIQEVMEIEQEGWLRSIRLGPHVKPVLDRLKAGGIRLGIVSNAAYRPDLMRRQLEHLGLLSLFDAVTFSSEVGLRKPHPAIYEDALAKLGVEPQAAVFVGDRLREDVEGPRRLGMRTVLLREWRRDDANRPPADFTIDRLTELIPIVERLQAETEPRPTYN